MKMKSLIRQREQKQVVLVVLLRWGSNLGPFLFRVDPPEPIDCKVVNPPLDCKGVNPPLDCKGVNPPIDCKGVNPPLDYVKVLTDCVKV